MSNHIGAGTNTNGWLGFELSVLRRLKFRSVALPLEGEPNLGLYRRNWKVRGEAERAAGWRDRWRGEGTAGGVEWVWSVRLQVRPRAPAESWCRW